MAHELYFAEHILFCKPETCISYCKAHAEYTRMRRKFVAMDIAMSSEFYVFRCSNILSDKMLQAQRKTYLPPL